ncbi:ABC transporter ATP-binding protein/permease [Enterococcus casseliflavus]|nr:ABC transporter ATP-binding protein/permease [Enterococcus casseliflavus]
MIKSNQEMKGSSSGNSIGPSGPGMGLNTEHAKAKNFSGTWLKLLLYCKEYWTRIIIALLSAVLGTALTLFGPQKLSEMTDLIQNGIATTIDLKSISEIGILLGILYIMGMILTSMQGILMANVTQRITENLRTKMSKKINKLPMSYFSKSSTGDIISRFTNDVDTIGQSLNQSIGNLISSVTLLVGSLFLMIVTNVTLTITAVFTTTIGFGLMILIMNKSQKYFSKQQSDIGEINAHVEEMYTGNIVIKAYNGEEHSQQIFDKMNDNLRISAFKSQSLSGLMMPIMQFIGNFGYVAVCVVGSVLVLNEQIGFGVIVAFIMYVRYFTQPLSQIAQSFQSLQAAAASSERVFEFLESTEMKEETFSEKVVSSSGGLVEFKNISFGYDSNKNIINNFSLLVNPGQKIAIVGPTGAGKTTIINLLMKFYELEDGEILLDGISTRKMRREEVASRFCMVLQDTWLFEGTVRENLIYSMENISEEDIRRACQSVGIDHFIRTLPEGYETTLNDQVSLSVGQKQQLTIARAMIANKSILILDEATSSIDTRTEVKIQNAMDQLMKERTSFVIAHRLSTIKNADLILVMNNGEIVERGTHDELLSRGGMYSETYYSQFQH